MGSTDQRYLPAYKSGGVFVIAAAILIFLWLPPLPYEVWVSDLPLALPRIFSRFGIFKPNDTLRLRWDYIGIPLLIPFVIYLTWKSRTDLVESGLSFSNFGKACRYLFWPTLAGVIILLIIGYTTHPLEFGFRFVKRLVPIPAFFQQLVIQLFFHRQLYPWWGKTKFTAIVVTIFFVVLHAPNPGLMIGTLFGMYFWARCYQLYPNLYALSLSHALLSAVLMQTMPQWLLPSVSVGSRFVEKGIAHHWWGWF